MIDLYNIGKSALREKKERIRTERNQAGTEPEVSSSLAITHSAGECYKGCLGKQLTTITPKQRVYNIELPGNIVQLGV